MPVYVYPDKERDVNVKGIFIKKIEVSYSSACRSLAPCVRLNRFVDWLLAKPREGLVQTCSM